MNSAGSDSIGIPMICLKIWSPKVKKQFSIKYKIASLKESFVKVIPFNEGLVTHLAPDLVADRRSRFPPLKQISVISLRT